MSHWRFIYYFCWSALISIKLCESAKILALFPLPMGSHMNFIKALVVPLIEKGHEVDVVTQYPLKIDHERYSDIDISKNLPKLKDNITIERSLVGDMLKMGEVFDLFGHTVTDAILKTKEMTDLRNSSKKYDLILRHIYLTDPLEAFSHLFQIPSIGMITSASLPWVADIIGLPDNPAYIPNYFNDFGEYMNLPQKTYNTLTYLYVKFRYFFHNRADNKLIRKYFGHNLPPVEELVKKSTLILCNSHYTIHQSRAVPPNFIEIGGLHVFGRKSKPLPEHLKSALDEANQGAIYVSFGSMIKSDTFSIASLKAIFDALGNVPHKVFWKGQKANFSKILNIPKNIQFETWMPQLDVLCHPNVKLFISHGGLFGIQEAIYCGVPILGTPFAADQGLNLQYLVEKDVAKLVPYNDIPNGPFDKALEILLQKKYLESAKILSKRFMDRPMSPIDTAIYWIEYVINHKGAPFLKSSASKLTWYQYYLLDVIGVFLLIVLIIILSLYLLIKQLYIIVPKSKKFCCIYDLLKKRIKID